MNDKDINNLKEMLIDFNEYSTDYTKTRCRELEETIKNTLKEIERLNNIIKEYKNANEYHQKIIHELETMKQPNQLHSENVKLRAENNRLNNIINELEEWLEESIEKHTEDYLDWKYDKNVYLAGSEKLQNVFDKLQELKGSEK